MATFDDAALNKLTAKIDNKLAGPRFKTGGNESTKEYSNKKRKQISDRDVGFSGPPSSKRSRNEGIKSKDKGNDTTSKTGNKTKTKAKNLVGSNIDILLDEIKALGGSEEDLRLVENIDSGDEDVFEDRNDVTEKGKDADDKLRAELAQFAAGLGFENVAPDFAAAETESEAQEEESLGEEIERIEDGVDGKSRGDRSDNRSNNRSNRAAASSATDLGGKSRGVFKGKTVSKLLIAPPFHNSCYHYKTKLTYPLKDLRTSS